MKKSQHTTISIIEDCKIYTAWACLALENNKTFQIVSKAQSGHLGIESIKNCQPNILLLDFQLPDISGLEVARLVKIYSPKTKIFAFTAHTEKSIVKRIIAETNIYGLAIKGSRYFKTNFTIALQAMTDDERYIDPILYPLFQDLNDNNLSQLTKREFEVFVQLVCDKSDEGIANDLSVDISHIKNLKSRIYKKIKRNELITISKQFLRNIK